MTRSQDLFARAQQHLAGGVGSGTRSPRAGWRPCPVFVRSGQGSRITDADGNTYIDYQMGQGPLILGHRPPALIEAVHETFATRGSHFALCHDLEEEAAAAVSARVPSIELLRFGSSGTECAMYALRFARAATGRQKVLRFEGQYHGWSDAIHWSAHPGLPDAGPLDRPAVAPSSTGIPTVVGDSLVVATWNDVVLLEQAFAEHGDELAAVICEPIAGNAGGLLPTPGYLERMRELATRHGAVLIFDEVLTGFRVARGCAQELLGVTPDLTVLAKAIAGGLPVAAVGGSRAAMAVVAEGRTMHGGTYNANPLACAAVIATMRETGRPGFYEDLLARGERLAAGLVEAARGVGLEASTTGVGSLFQLWFADVPPAGYREALTLVASSPFPAFHGALLERLVLTQPPQQGLFLMSGAHTDEDVDETLALARGVMPLVREARDAGAVGPAGRVR
jgi:glutamate-1-semialdehyde 2,1-aminomutase